MSRSFDPYPPEVARWLVALRERAQPANSHISPGASPADVLRLLDLIDDLAAHWRANERLLVGDLRTLPADEFIARALAEGLYRVDLAAGRLFSGTTGLAMGRLRTNGYIAASLNIGGIGRTMSVHRIVAVAAWGVDVVRGKQIAHLNHDKTDNRLENLKVLSADEHAAYDYAEGRRRSYRTGTPCARCGFRRGEGSTTHRNRMTSGARFGIAGPLCDNCYHLLWRERKKDDVAAQG